MMGEIEGERRRQQMVGWHHRLNGHELEPTLGDSERWEAWCATVCGITKSQTQLSNSTTTNVYSCYRQN